MDILLSQAAAEQCEKAERGYLTINPWHMLGEADLLFRGHDRWQTTDDKGVIFKREDFLKCAAVSNKQEAK